MCFDPISYLMGKKAGGGGGSSAIVSKTITANGTYNASSDSADGYNPVVVNVEATEVLPKAVNFIDYDGTILYSYTAQEYSALSALPSNPSHTGLVAQGWNWTKSQIDSHLLEHPKSKIWIGQMYITQSGDTEIDIEIPNSERLDPVLSLAVDGEVLINWGDMSADNITGSDLEYIQEISHSYSSPGSYTISIHVIDGEFYFGSDDDYSAVCHKYNMSISESCIYSSFVKNARFGVGTKSIGSGTFYNCNNLMTVTIPNTIENSGWAPFYGCCSLASVTIPSMVTILNGSLFEDCSNLKTVSIPDTVTYIDELVFSRCRNLSSITMPDNITEIESGAFSDCDSLMSFTIPEQLTYIPTSMFAGCKNLHSVVIKPDIEFIPYCAFSNCSNLLSITIPNTVAEIGGGAFGSCYGMKSYHIQSETPPQITTSGTPTFYGIPDDTKIYVPESSVNIYKQDSSWGIYSGHILGE